MPGGRPGKRTGLSGVSTLPHDEPAGDLGAARVVDDRQAAAADDVEEPAPRLGIPRLAGGAEDAQRREIVRADRVARRGASASGSAWARRRGC